MVTAPAKRRRHVAVALGLCAVVVSTWCPLAATSAPLSLPANEEPAARVAAWPSWLGGGRPLFNRSTTPGYAPPAVPDTPHPAVARIIVPEEDATSYGSGTLVDVRDEFGLVITNWHVVRDSQGTVEVVFPSGFRSHARPLKVDSDWDLAALVIWRPPIEPVHVSAVPPQPGERLTIHGYGQGQYRIATGHCTAYYAPKINYPREMVELDVEARQGDSGGPIFNQRGELAGVLFGAGEGTTIGSFAPRVESFLATLAPDIGAARDAPQLAIADRPAPAVHPAEKQFSPTASLDANAERRNDWPSSAWNAPRTRGAEVAAAHAPTDTADEVTAGIWYDGAKSVLALVGIVAVALQLMRLAK